MSEVRSVTDLKRSTSAMVDRVHEDGSAVIITANGRAKAVLIDVRAYDELCRSLAMLKLVAQAEHDVARGRVVAQDAVEARLRRAR